MIQKNSFRLIPYVLAILVLGLASACAPRIERTPFAASDTGLAYGVPGSENRSGLTVDAISGPTIAFSGGGQKGAYGAGVMVGWTARGDRPEFAVVTGVSTGGILALFSFLGPEQDSTLETLYTEYQTRDLIQREILEGLLGGTALNDATPYRALIDQYVSDIVIEDLAGENARGRKLLIGSTDLDGKSPYLWDVTAIAASGHPARGQLIRDIIQASSAIPAIFPPVLIPFSGLSGQSGDRLHVDGGITRPFVFRPLIAHATGQTARTYLVINEFVEPQFKPVDPNLRSVAAASVQTAITSSVVNEIAVFANLAKRNSIPWRGTAVPSSFVQSPTQEFDPVYMKGLFDMGRDSILEGRTWTLQASAVQTLR